jgi:replicative DNA helicase
MIKPATEIELFEQSLIDQDNIEDNIQTADQLIDDQDARRMLYQGKEFMGLPQRTLPKLDDLLSGLRKFIVLAAAPNVGKTAMSIQLVVDVIQKNDDACAIFMSLEMSRNDIMDRIRCYLASITWKQLYFGKLNSNDKGFYTREEQKQLDESKKILQTIGNRILILDDKCCKDISALTIKTKIEQLKKKSRCEKAIVVIDYLQVFPVSETELLKLRTENDIDRHRISQIIMLRDILQDDPLIVIAEARKPSGAEKAWGVSMADILGSSRTAYACDAGMLLNQMSDDELSKELGISKDNCSDVRDQLKQKGQTIVKLTIDKARDGMQKGNILIMFHFLQNKFEEVSWMDIKTRIEIPLMINNKKDATVKQNSNSNW